jgi:hypothetical protein
MDTNKRIINPENGIFRIANPKGWGGTVEKT